LRALLPSWASRDDDAIVFEDVPTIDPLQLLTISEFFRGKEREIHDDKPESATRSTMSSPALLKLSKRPETLR
jgi:hypothetical protein